LTISNAGRNNRTATFEISFEESTPISWNCEAITPTKMVSKTATDACRAPKKGISNSSVAWPMMYDERKAGIRLPRDDKTSKKAGTYAKKRD
jgi:hypothetical protein